MSLSEQLSKIKAKIILEMPLTDKEKAIWILYGDTK